MAPTFPSNVLISRILTQNNQREVLRDQSGPVLRLAGVDAGVVLFHCPKDDRLLRRAALTVHGR